MTNEQQRAFVAALLTEVREGDLTQRQAARILATLCLILTDVQPYCWRLIGEMPPAPGTPEPAAPGAAI
jgi:hypothetical protein